MHAEHALLRYSGDGNDSGFYSHTGRLEAYRCAVEFGAGAGIDFGSWMTPCEVVACRFDDNAGVAVDGAPVEILPGLDSNTAAGNLGGDFVRAQGGILTQSTSVGPRNLIGGSLVFPSWLGVLEGVELTLEAGTAFKFAGTSSFMSVAGKLTARGTASNPVFFSSIADDTLGGDTNGDGPSTGNMGDWRGLWNSNTQTGGDLDLEHVLIRNGGALNGDNLQMTAGAHRLVAVRSENSAASGFYFSQVGFPSTQVVNCIAVDNFFAGFEVYNSSLNLLHVTATDNQTGVYSSNAPGSVRNSLVWGNGIDFQTPAGTIVVTHTTAVNGPAGTGNSSADPLFVDAPNGDLRLAPGSPAVDSADNAFALALGRDALDAPRLLNPTASGFPVADRGAFEQTRWELSLTGSQAVGELVTLRVDGEPGVSLVYFSSQLTNVPVAPLGVLLIGPAGLIALPAQLVGQDLTFALPSNPAFAGLELGFQAITFLASDPNQAQLSDRELLRFEKALP